MIAHTHPSQLHSLPRHHYSEIDVQALHQPQWLLYNHQLAQQLNFPNSAAQPDEWLLWLSGSLTTPPQTPIATVYSGHQFGIWAGQLGDGRAVLLGEACDQDGQTWEIQLKGAGQTPYSRRADGRAVLRSSIREYLCSEYMHALGIPTTRALALIGSDDVVYREQAETAAVVTRVAPSFLRFGHLEHWYHQGQNHDLQQLVNWVLEHHYPDCLNEDNPYLALFATITQRSADLVASWQSVGFCHGVLNTDNMSLLGLTIDYGPFAFMDGFDPHYICNHSDQHGRYAYHAQPAIVQWNLSCLASCFLPLATEAELVAVLNGFVAQYQQSYLQKMRAKLGLQQEQEGDLALVEALLKAMAAQRIDFSLCFRHLSQIKRDDNHLPDDLANVWSASQEDLILWLASYRTRLQSETLTDAQRSVWMNQTNPKYVLRQHLLQQAIEQAQNNDVTGIETLYHVITNPYDEHPQYQHLAALPPDWAAGICVSCSS